MIDSIPVPVLIFCAPFSVLCVECALEWILIWNRVLLIFLVHSFSPSEMATSSHVSFAMGEKDKKRISSSYISSPKNVKKVISPGSSSCNSVHPPMCVCAPATHAGSFKCRFHRVKSHPPSPTKTAMHPKAVLPTPPPNTVHAQ